MREEHGPYQRLQHVPEDRLISDGFFPFGIGRRSPFEYELAHPDALSHLYAAGAAHDEGLESGQFSFSGIRIALPQSGRYR